MEKYGTIQENNITKEEGELSDEEEFCEEKRNGTLFAHAKNFQFQNRNRGGSLRNESRPNGNNRFQYTHRQLYRGETNDIIEDGFDSGSYRIPPVGISHSPPPPPRHYAPSTSSSSSRGPPQPPYHLYGSQGYSRQRPLPIDYSDYPHRQISSPAQSWVQRKFRTPTDRFGRQIRKSDGRKNVGRKDTINKEILRDSNPDDESNFEELLEKYKRIQRELECLEVEEEGDEIPCPQSEIKSSNSNKDSESVTENNIVDSQRRVEIPLTNAVEDDELDELELRRIALESAAARANKQRNKNDVKSLPPANKQNTVPPPAQSKNMTASNGSIEKQDKQSTPSPNNKKLSPLTKSQRRRNRRYQRGRKSSPQKKSLKQKQEEKQRQLETQRREIQRILTLDDPQEQADRFLRFLNVDQSKRQLIRTSHTGKTSGQLKQTNVKLTQLQDNYEQVEMDIDDSNDGSPSLNLENTAVCEEFKFDPDFQNAMKPVPLLISQPSAPPPPIPSHLPYPPTWFSMAAPVPLPASYSQFLYQQPPPPLPLCVPPSVPQPPPPLPEEPPPAPPLPPPPLPSEPPPDETILPPLPPPLNDSEAPPQPPEHPALELEADEAALLRAQLLKSIAEKRKHVVNAEPKAGIKPSSSDVSPSGSRDQSPAPLGSRDQSPAPLGSTNQSPATLGSRDQSPAPLDSRNQSPAPLGSRNQSPAPLGSRNQSPALLGPRNQSPTPSGSRSDSPIPSVSRGLSPAPSATTNKKVPQKTKVTTFTMLPVHKRVVIPMDDSSEDEDDSPVKPSTSMLLGGLDTFLKQARMSAESVSPPKSESTQSVADDPVIQQRLKLEQIQEHEENLTRQRLTIQRDQALLKSLVTRASKYLDSVKMTEQKTEKLREQLVAAEKVISAIKQQAVKTKSQARVVQQRLLERKLNFSDLEKMAVSLGKEVYGPSYQPRMIAVQTLSAEKRKLDTLTVTVFNDLKKKKQKMSVSTKENAPPVKTLQQKKTAEFIAKEKLRLQNLEKEYAEKIRLLKAGQSPKPKVDQRRVVKNVLPSNHVRTSQSVITNLEKIKLSMSASELLDAAVLNKPRRRSLIELNPSNKPNIPTPKKDNNISVSRTDSAATESTAPVFKMPSGQQLNNLRKLQIEKNKRILQGPLLNCPCFCHFHSLMTQVKEIPGLLFKRKMDTKITMDTSAITSLQYRSPLLKFKAYRFSPYYRTKANLTIPSITYSNKIDPKKIFCRFDIQGRCNDEKCTGQHQRDYKMSGRDILEDLVSYCPKLVGITSDQSPVEYRKSIASGVESLVAQHKGKISMDDLCLIATSRVTETTAKFRPFTMFYEARKFKPILKETNEKHLQDDTDFIRKPFKSFDLLKQPGHKDLESVVGEEDVRYFGADISDIQTMETGLLENPANVDLWLKLANRKLSSENSPESCLDHSLSVLARGLEANKSSSDLWFRYLVLYRKHEDAKDIVDLCQTALQYAPSYDVWWQYLEAATSFSAKDEICNKMIDFVQNQTEICVKKRSHQLLEIILYKTSLNSQTGRYKRSIVYLQSIVKSGSSDLESSRLLLVLEPCDRCLLWLSYIHLLEFHQLPPQLYNPANQNPAKIMSKRMFLLPWDSKTELSTPVDTLVQYLCTAADVCSGEPGADNPVYAECISIHQNLVHLLKSQSRWEEACSACRRILEQSPSLVDMWLTAANLYASCGDVEVARQVFSEAAMANPLSAKLHFFQSLFEMKQPGGADRALELLEQFVISHFEMDELSLRSCDPNILYSVILGQSVSVKTTTLHLKSTVTQETLKEQKAYHWLAFSLLLELQGDMKEAEEMFETALSSTMPAQHLKTLWINYADFLYRQLPAEMTSVSESQRLMSVMTSSVLSMPTKFDVAYSSDVWLDYSFVNEMVEKYCTFFSHSDRLTVLEMFLEMMPLNVQLLLSCLQEAIKNGEFLRARSLCNPAAFEEIPNVLLWKVVISLAQKEGTNSQMEKFYLKAVRALPYAITLWKDFLLFEVAQGNSDSVEKIVTRCVSSGLNIQGFVATISS